MNEFVVTTDFPFSRPWYVDSFTWTFPDKATDPRGTLETSANTLSFIFAHLALYPEVQDKVYEEIMSVWPTEEDALYGAEVCLKFFFYSSAP